MSIHEKILEIMKAVQHIQKDDTVSYKSTNYKALSEEKVTTILRAEMIKNGLVVYPIKQDWSRAGSITHVDVTYKIVDTETGESIEVVSCGDGADTQDKGAGKAMTYAYKYMWLRVFAIPTGEDPDKISTAELDDMEKAAKEKENKKSGKTYQQAEGSETPPVEMFDATQNEAVQRLLTDAPPERIEAFNKALDFYKVENVAQLTRAQGAQLIRRLKKYE